MGWAPGDRIATLAWNTQHHVEIWYAVMGVGLVCHTLNPRLTVAHLAAMITQADDRVLAVGAGLRDMAEALLAACPASGAFDLARWRTLRRNAPRSGDLDLHARSARRLGPVRGGPRSRDSASPRAPPARPKGVAYTHRSNYLHTLRALLADSIALTAADAVLVAVPMFHANAWGLPFAAPAVGADLVLPGRVTDGARLAGLIDRHQVTVAVGVPTVWLGLLDHLDAVGGETESLERIIIGGSSCPDSLLRRMEDRFGATVQTSWGMTELSPLGAISPRSRQPGAARGSGRPPMGLDLLLTDADGVPLPEQRNAVGHLKVKGQSVIERYFDAAETALDADGWFDNRRPGPSR